MTTMTLEETGDLAAGIRAEIAKAIVGQEEVTERLLIALIAQGHVLLEIGRASCRERV